jgi:hypothetical protein
MLSGRSKKVADVQEHAYFQKQLHAYRPIRSRGKLCLNRQTTSNKVKRPLKMSETVFNSLITPTRLNSNNFVHPRLE